MQMVLAYKPIAGCPDVLARYFRAKGDKVCSAALPWHTGRHSRKPGNKTAAQISDFYHDEFTDCFKGLVLLMTLWENLE